ncbi:hypothetical protein L9F63_014966 [Diploptera punctata]|uniref:C-type lectin domain-containing protein n=1 Tax=Diploptera punctata TaxID=6984 RepID=A0AAD8A6Q4_DIPPU|nr:hypothetical protein L9F63_014966 [Diploptera punctata]
MILVVNLFLICGIFMKTVHSTKLQCENLSQLAHSENEYNYGICKIHVDQRVERNQDGQSILLNVTLSSSSGCQTKKPEIKGYVHLSGYGYYKYHSSPRTWIQAWDICKSEGGHLAVPNSEEEAKFIGKIPATSYNWAYIGIHDLFKEGKYITVHDETLIEAGFNKWLAPNPNGGTNENCGVIFPTGELGDDSCSHVITFFCEISY